MIEWFVHDRLLTRLVEREDLVPVDAFDEGEKPQFGGEWH
jgi:hypothetical protein